MSGTSLDGLDIAIVHADSMRSHYCTTVPMPGDLKCAIEAIYLGQATNLRQIGELDHRIALHYAQAINQTLKAAQVSADNVSAIGSHGQTVYHQPEGPWPFTMQLGDANIVAARTGIPVAADFRRMDMAVGGQGAPLVPAFHQAMFAGCQHRAIINIGGIANITVLKPQQATLGYDTGPGNMLMNEWIEKQKGIQYDESGNWAASGRPCEPLVQELLLHRYFAANPPKSTGRELFNLTWLTPYLDQYPQLSPADIQASLLELTSRSITLSLEQQQIEAAYLCGGGCHNHALVRRLKAHNPKVSIATTQALGIDPDYVEAIAFAWLAKQRVGQEAANLPVVTGANSAVILGGLYRASANSTRK
ncbi:anhydro-N-acetylmuramic acid kinase [Motilimonas pumila]|uniref:Anhydro-N-acetylmuramic acid kinase n=2 Tax=Motilimonas pumila TaxID=2303987 RepID=A0A418YCY0_9GAMM|nr:anhydro-N-acetylmuramic acid kinase [Motilimonas pumila]